jgi:hypothetical protein
MKCIHFLLAFSVIAFSGCSTSKNSQSGDSYYSTGNSNGNSGYYKTATSDQYVQMRVQDPARWSYFDNYYDDAFAPMGYGSYYDMGAYGYGFGAPWLTFGYWNPYTYWNSYYAWNSFYNPYYGAVVIASPKSPVSGLSPQVSPYSASNFANLRNYGRGVGRTSGSLYSQPLRSTGYSSSRHEGFSNGPGYNSYRSSFGQSMRSTSSPSSFGGSSGGGMRTGGGGFGRR